MLYNDLNLASILFRVWVGGKVLSNQPKISLASVNLMVSAVLFAGDHLWFIVQNVEKED